MYSIILCGGSGTRLWPLSRKNFAKQFLKLYSDKSLLQETFLRMKAIVGKENVYFVTNQENFFNVYNQLKEVDADISKENIIMEPAAMNTAPAIALGMAYLSEKVGIGEDAPVIINPADHYIGNPDEYARVVKKALEEVGDNIGTIGITPTGPETGFGYIKKGAKKHSYFEAESFKEKPDKETAQKYLESGDYVWNGGIYLFNVKTFTEEIKKHAPGLWEKFSKSFEKFASEYETLQAESIDIAVSEKSDRIVIFEGDFEWNDIGSFDALADIIRGNGDEQKRHIRIDSNNVFMYSSSGKLIAAVDVDDLIVVENNDAILIQKRGKSEDVKKVVNYLKEKDYKEIEHNVIGYRPWGSYEVLVTDKNHQVKRITVFPGASLSLQTHEHRAEHWVVVRGTAQAINGENILVLHENESTYIPVGAMHRLSNPGKEILEIIEVQTGDYLGEDDIKRYKDEYGRPSGTVA